MDLSTRSPASRSRFAARVNAGLLALVLLAVAASAYVLWHQWRFVLQRAEVQADNTAILIENDITGTLDKVAVALGSIAAQLEREMGASHIERRTLWPLVDSVAALVPEVSYVGVVDAQGRQVCGPPQSRCLQLDVSDREYFRAIRDNPATTDKVFGPVRSRIDGRWSLVVTEAVHDADGGFLGMVGAQLPLERFKSRLADLDLGPHGAISLRRAGDLRLIVRHPGPLRSDDEARNREVSEELVRALRRAPDAGGYRAATRLDGIERQNAYRRLDRYPILVIVGVGTRDALASWTGFAWWMLGFVLLFVAASAAIVVLLRRGMRQQQRLQAQLEVRVEERTQQLRRLAGEVERAEARERQQVARDLHDDLAQTLAAARIRLEPLCHSLAEPVRDTACRVAELVDQADRSTRSLAAQLAPAVLYELGLAPALERLGEDIERNLGMQVSVSDDGQPKPLAPEARSILYRCTRELLVNAAKHAGTPQADVEIEASDGQVVVRVADAGVGFESGDPPDGMGLRHVRERLSYIGGSFRIESRPGIGTEAVLTAPLDGGPAHSRAMPSRTA